MLPVLAVRPLGIVEQEDMVVPGLAVSERRVAAGENLGAFVGKEIERRLGKETRTVVLTFKRTVMVYKRAAPHDKNLFPVAASGPAAITSSSQRMAARLSFGPASIRQTVASGFSLSLADRIDPAVQVACQSSG